MGEEVKKLVAGLRSGQVDVGLFCAQFKKLVERRVHLTKGNVLAQLNNLRQAIDIFSNVRLSLPNNTIVEEIQKDLFLKCARTILSHHYLTVPPHTEVSYFRMSINRAEKLLQHSGYGHRFNMIKWLMNNHWRHPILRKLFLGDQLAYLHGVNYVKLAEFPELLRLRVELLMDDDCPDFALNLCLWCLENPKMNFDPFLRAVQLMLLHVRGFVDLFFEQCHTLPCCIAVQILDMVEPAARCNAAFLTLTQTFMLQDWLKPRKYCCTMRLLEHWLEAEYLRELTPGDVEYSARCVADISSENFQLALLMRQLSHMFGVDCMQLQLDLGLLALRRSLRDIETKSSGAKPRDLLGYRSCLTYLCTVISCACAGWSVKLRRVAMLTAFSLEPRRDIFKALSMLYDPTLELERTMGSANGPGPPRRTTSFSPGMSRVWVKQEAPEITEGFIEGVSAVTLMNVIQALDRIRSPDLDPTLPWLLLEQVCEHYRNSQLHLTDPRQTKPYLDLESHPRLQMGNDTDPLDILYSIYVKATLDSASMECVPSLPMGAATSRDQRPVVLTMEIPPIEEEDEMDLESDAPASESPPATEEVEEEPGGVTPDDASLHSDKTWNEEASQKSEPSSDTEDTDDTIPHEAQSSPPGHVYASISKQTSESPEEAAGPSSVKPQSVIHEKFVTFAEHVRLASGLSAHCDPNVEPVASFPVAAQSESPDEAPTKSDPSCRPAEALPSQPLTPSVFGAIGQLSQSDAPSVAMSLASEPPPIEVSRSCEPVALEQPAVLDSSTVEPSTPECPPPLQVSEMLPDLVEHSKPSMVRQASLEEHTTLIETCDRMWTPTGQLEISKWASSPAGSTDSDYVQTVVAMVEPCNQDVPPIPEPLIVENMVDQPKGASFRTVAPGQEADNYTSKPKDEQRRSSCQSASKLDPQISHPSGGGGNHSNFQASHMMAGQTMLQNPVVVLKDVALNRSYASHQSAPNGSGSATLQHLLLATTGNVAEVPTAMMCQPHVRMDQENKPLATSSPNNKRPILPNMKNQSNSHLPMTMPAQAVYGTGQVPAHFMSVRHLLSPPHPARVLSSSSMFASQPTPQVPGMTTLRMTASVAPPQSFSPAVIPGPSQPLVPTDQVVISSSGLLLPSQPAHKLVMVMPQSAGRPPPRKDTAVTVHPASSLLQQLSNNVVMSTGMSHMNLPAPRQPHLELHRPPPTKTTVPLAPPCQISISALERQPVETLATRRPATVDVPAPQCSCGMPAHTEPCRTPAAHTIMSSGIYTETTMPVPFHVPAVVSRVTEPAARDHDPHSLATSIDPSGAGEQNTSMSSMHSAAEGSPAEEEDESVEYADVAIQTDPCDDEDIMNLDFSAEDGDVSIALTPTLVTERGNPKQLSHTNVPETADSVQLCHTETGIPVSIPGSPPPSGVPVDGYSSQPSKLAQPNLQPSVGGQDIECISLLSSSSEETHLDAVMKEQLAPSTTETVQPVEVHHVSEYQQPQCSAEADKETRSCEDTTPAMAGECHHGEQESIADLQQQLAPNGNVQGVTGSNDMATLLMMKSSLPPEQACAPVSVDTLGSAIYSHSHGLEQGTEFSGICAESNSDDHTLHHPAGSSPDTQRSEVDDSGSPEDITTSVSTSSTSPSTSPRAKSPRQLDPAALQRKKVLQAGVRRAEQPVNPNPRTLSPFIRKFFPHRDQQRTVGQGQEPVEVQLQGKSIKTERASPQSSPPAGLRDAPLDLDLLMRETRQEINNVGDVFNFDNFKSTLLRLIQDRLAPPVQRNGEPGLTVSQDLRSMNIVLASGASKKSLKIQGMNQGIFVACKTEDGVEIKRFIGNDQRILKVFHYGENQLKAATKDGVDKSLLSTQSKKSTNLPAGLESLLQSSSGKVKVTIKKTNQAGSRQVFNVPIASSIFTLSTPVEAGKKAQPIIKHISSKKVEYKFSSTKSEPNSPAAGSVKSPVKSEAAVSANGPKCTGRLDSSYVTTHYIIANAKHDGNPRRKSPIVLHPTSSLVSQRKSPTATQEPNQHVPDYIITSISPANPRISHSPQTVSCTTELQKPVTRVAPPCVSSVGQVSPRAVPRGVTTCTAAGNTRVLSCTAEAVSSSQSRVCPTTQDAVISPFPATQAFSQHGAQKPPTENKMPIITQLLSSSIDSTLVKENVKSVAEMDTSKSVSVASQTFGESSQRSIVPATECSSQPPDSTSLPRKRQASTDVIQLIKKPCPDNAVEKHGSCPSKTTKLLLREEPLRRSSRSYTIVQTASSTPRPQIPAQDSVCDAKSELELESSETQATERVPRCTRSRSRSQDSKPDFRNDDLCSSDKKPTSVVTESVLGKKPVTMNNSSKNKSSLEQNDGSPTKVSKDAGDKNVIPMDTLKAVPAKHDAIANVKNKASDISSKCAKARARSTKYRASYWEEDFSIMSESSDSEAGAESGNRECRPKQRSSRRSSSSNSAGSTSRKPSTEKAEDQEEPAPTQPSSSSNSAGSASRKSSTEKAEGQEEPAPTRRLSSSNSTGSTSRKTAAENAEGQEEPAPTRCSSSSNSAGSTSRKPSTERAEGQEEPAPTRRLWSSNSAGSTSQKPSTEKAEDQEKPAPSRRLSSSKSAGSTSRKPSTEKAEGQEEPAPSRRSSSSKSAGSTSRKPSTEKAEGQEEPAPTRRLWSSNSAGSTSQKPSTEKAEDQEKPAPSRRLSSSKSAGSTSRKPSTEKAEGQEEPAPSRRSSSSKSAGSTSQKPSTEKAEGQEEPAPTRRLWSSNSAGSTSQKPSTEKAEDQEKPAPSRRLSSSKSAGSTSRKPSTEKAEGQEEPAPSRRSSSSKSAASTSRKPATEKAEGQEEPAQTQPSLSSNSAGSTSRKTSTEKVEGQEEPAPEASRDAQDEAEENTDTDDGKLKKIAKNDSKATAQPKYFTHSQTNSKDKNHKAKENAKSKAGNSPKTTEKRDNKPCSRNQPCKSSLEKLKTDSHYQSPNATKCTDELVIKPKLENITASQPSHDTGKETTIGSGAHCTQQAMSETGYAKAFAHFLSTPSPAVPISKTAMVMTNPVRNWKTEDDEAGYQSGYMREYTKWFQGKTYQPRNGQKKDLSPSAKPKMSEAEEKYLKIFEQDHNVKISSQTYDNVCQQSSVHNFAKTVSPVVKVSKLEHALSRLPGPRKRHFSTSSLCSRGSVSSELSELTCSKLRRTRSSTADSDSCITETLAADYIVVSDDSLSENGSAVSECSMMEYGEHGSRLSLRPHSRASAPEAIAEPPVSSPLQGWQDSGINQEKPPRVTRARSRSIDSRSLSPNERLSSPNRDCDTDRSSRSCSQGRARSRSTSRAHSPVNLGESQCKKQPIESDKSSGSEQDCTVKIRSSSRLSVSQSNTSTKTVSQVHKKITAEIIANKNHQKDSSKIVTCKRQSDGEIQQAAKRRSIDSCDDAAATSTSNMAAPVRRGLRREAKSTWEKEFLKCFSKP